MCQCGCQPMIYAPKVVTLPLCLLFSSSSGCIWCTAHLCSVSFSSSLSSLDYDACTLGGVGFPGGARSGRSAGAAGRSGRGHAGQTTFHPGSSARPAGQPQSSPVASKQQTQLHLMLPTADPPPPFPPYPQWDIGCSCSAAKVPNYASSELDYSMSHGEYYTLSTA